MPFADPAKRKEWYLKNRERLIASSMKWQKDHPEQYAETRKRFQTRHGRRLAAEQRDLRKREPERTRGYRIKSAYGITYDQFQELFNKQGHSCACCGSDKPRGRNWHVDHSHVTGEVRGILCGPCNVGIGALGDNVDGVRLALKYLERQP